MIQGYCIVFFPHTELVTRHTVLLSFKRAGKRWHIRALRVPHYRFSFGLPVALRH